MFKPRLRIPRGGVLRPIQLIPRRSKFTVNHIGYSGVNGIPGLLTADGFHLAWTQYQQHIINKLNELTVGTTYENLTVQQILIKTSRDPAQAVTFNYASMAFNNHFFFNFIDPDLDQAEDGTVVPAKVPLYLKQHLEQSFSSMETLRREMILTASAMFGPGFVWLVKNARSNNYRILTTYLAGTPFMQAHWRRQGVNMTNYGLNSDEATGPVQEYTERTAAGVGATHGGKWLQTAPGGIETIPILCVNTWEHVWLRDYGVGIDGNGGKRVYLENWWNVINWEKVDDLANPTKSLLTS